MKREVVKLGFLSAGRHLVLLREVLDFHTLARQLVLNDADWNSLIPTCFGIRQTDSNLWVNEWLINKRGCGDFRPRCAYPPLFTTAQNNLSTTMFVRTNSLVLGRNSSLALSHLIGHQSHSRRIPFADQRTNTRGVRPVAPVGGGAVIHQVGLEPPRSQTPIDVQVLGEEAGHVLPTPVAHEARLFEFDHVRIHKGFAGLSSAPSFKVSRGIGPAKISILGSASSEETWSVLQQVQAKILPPNQFKAQPVGGVVRHPFCFVPQRLGGNVPR